MRCPRCFLADIPEGARACVLCGYSPSAQPPSPASSRARKAASAAADAAPSGPPVAVEEAPLPLTELDARRELSAEFRIEALLRRSPEPIVYLAWEGDDVPLTLKALAPEALADEGADKFAVAAERAMQLEHSHIAPVYRFGCTDHFLWYATKRVDGRSLESILETVGPLELSACVRILEQVASALDHAHRRGAAHGALRAEHVIVDANEWVQVSDFVLGGLLQPPDEQRASEPAPRADQYALATLAYECLTGTPARDGPPLASLIDARTDIPLHVAQALRRALSARPAERFPSVLDFVAALGSPTAAAATPWFGAAPKRKPGSPMVIVADEEDEDEELDRPTRPPVRRPGRGGRRIAAAAGVVIVLAGGTVWLNTPSVPASTPSHETAQGAAAAQPDTAWSSTPSDSLPDVAPQPASTPPPPPTSAVRKAALPPARTAAVKRSPPPAPRVSRRQTTATPPITVPRIARPAEPALLSVNSIPWGSVFIDGDAAGNTPQIDLRLAPGPHRLRVERDGFRPFEREIVLAPGQQLRITDITLVER